MRFIEKGIFILFTSILLLFVALPAFAGEPADIELSADPASVYTNETSTITTVVRDVYLRPVPGVAVNFATSAGTLSATTVITDERGRAEVVLTPPSVPQSCVVTAYASSSVTPTGCVEGSLEVEVVGGYSTRKIILHFSSGPTVILPGDTKEYTFQAIGAKGLTLKFSASAGIVSPEEILIPKEDYKATFNYTAPSYETDGVLLTAVIPGETQAQTIIDVRNESLVIGMTQPVWMYTQDTFKSEVELYTPSGPVAGARVVFDTDKGEWTPVEAVTDVDGRARATYKAPAGAGKVKWTARAPEYDQEISVTVQIQARNLIEVYADPGEVPLCETSNIHGRVRNHDGTPRANASVNLSITTGPGTLAKYEVVTDSQGNFSTTYYAPKELTAPRDVEITASSQVLSLAGNLQPVSAKCYVTVYIAVNKPIPADERPEPVSLLVNPKYAAAQIGETEQFRAFLIYEDHTDEDVTEDPRTEWLTGDNKIAKVKKGLATGLAIGKTEVIARWGELEDSGTLAVFSLERQDTPPPVVNLPDGTIIDRMPMYLALTKPVKIDNPGKEIVLEYDPARTDNNEDRHPTIYYWHSKARKWVALATYPAGEGKKVKAVNDGGYSGWFTAFGVVKPTFTDTANHWAEQAANRMNSLGLLEGYPSPDGGLVRPAGLDREVTRTEFTVVVSRILGLNPGDLMYQILEPLPKDEANKVLSRFSDIVPGWAKGHIAAMVQAGLAEGRGSRFEGDAPISRIEAAVMVSRVLNQLPDKPTADLTEFADAQDVPDWAKDAVKAGVISGYPDGTLKPNRHITRAEAMSVLLRLLRALGW